MQYAELGDTVYLWFASNNTSGSGDDGASAVADVRLAGGAAGDAPVYSPTPTLLTHANYPPGCYEIAIQATTGNGFATNSTYAVFTTLAVSAQNPVGFVGAFAIGKAATAADLGYFETTIATATSQSSLILTDGSTADDAYNLRMITIQDASDPRFIDVVVPSDYVGSTKTLTLSTPTSTFSAVAGDTVRIYKDYNPLLILHPANVTYIRSTALIGSGTSSDPYRPTGT